MIFPLPKEHNLNLRRYLSVFTEEKIIDFYYWFLTSPELELKRQWRIFYFILERLFPYSYSKERVHDLNFSGTRKKVFIPALIGPFLEMTLVPDLGKFTTRYVEKKQCWHLICFFIVFLNWACIPSYVFLFIVISFFYKNILFYAQRKNFQFIQNSNRYDNISQFLFQFVYQR